MAIYKSVLHNPDNSLPFWFLEVVASYTSIINQCQYSLTHHFTNARRLIKDKVRSDAIYSALQDGKPEHCFDGKELALNIVTNFVNLMAEVIAERVVDMLKTTILREPLQASPPPPKKKSKSENKTPEKTAEPDATPEADDTPLYEQCKVKTSLLAKDNRPKAIEILKSYGAKKLPEVAEEKLGELLKDLCTALVEAEKE